MNNFHDVLVEFKKQSIELQRNLIDPQRIYMDVRIWDTCCRSEQALPFIDIDPKENKAKLFNCDVITVLRDGYFKVEGSYV